MNDLKALLERVEKAEGPDRELDAAIYNALYTDNYRPHAFHSFEQKFHAVHRYHDGWLVGKDNSDEWAENLPKFTASIDAAVALVEKMLPGWAWGVHVNPRAVGGFLAHVTERSPIRPMPNIGAAPTPALALCAALLRALIAKAE